MPPRAEAERGTTAAAKTAATLLEREHAAVVTPVTRGRSQGRQPRASVRHALGCNGKLGAIDTF